MIKRQIVLDTETTGINKLGLHFLGHKIIEIGAIEIINRKLTGNQFHTYINPNRLVDQEAYKIHGINNNFLKKSPTFDKISKNFIDFIKGSELIIHNAKFDIGFINYELSMLKNNSIKIENICTIIDSLNLARQIFPGKRNNLDSLCERYSIKNINRNLHGALLDSKILAKIYLLLTSGQTEINFNLNEIKTENKFIFKETNFNTKIIYANENEILNHNYVLNLIKKECKNCLWMD